MTQKRAPSAGYAVQGVLLLMFFVAWFFLQRNWWLPEVASIHGANLDPEFLITLAITGFMFIVLQVCLGVLALKFAENGKKRHRPQSRLFEKRFAIGAASFVFLVDISLFLMGESSFRAAMGASPENAVIVEATGERFAWNFRYPGPDGVFGKTDVLLVDLQSNPLGLDPDDPAAGDDIVRVNQLHVPSDRPIRVRIRSKDVLHSFALPNFRVKQDAVPGMEIEVGFEPTRTGEFEIMCSQLYVRAHIEQCPHGHGGWRRPCRRPKGRRPVHRSYNRRRVNVPGSPGL
jgi:cytochrome c oxidase subunit 2